MSRYRYAVKHWVDLEILLLLYFIIFAAKGYGTASGVTMLLLAVVCVVSLRKLNRSRNRA